MMRLKALLLLTGLLTLAHSSNGQTIKQVKDSSRLTIKVIDVVSMTALSDYTLSVANPYDTLIIKPDKAQDIYFDLDSSLTYTVTASKSGYRTVSVIWKYPNDSAYVEVEFFLSKQNISKDERLLAKANTSNLKEWNVHSRGGFQKITPGKGEFFIARVRIMNSGSESTSYESSEQVPERALVLADSVRKTRMLCQGTRLELVDVVYYPKSAGANSRDSTDIYFISFKVYIKEDMVSDLYVSIREDFSIKYISGVPDKSYPFSPCNILPGQELWKVAGMNGLKTRYRRCKYHLSFEDTGLQIKFLEHNSRWNADWYTVDAITGKFLGHTQMNVTF